MKQTPVVLSRSHREAVENVVQEHALIRGWELHAIAVRTNHIHVAVSVVCNGDQSIPIKRVRDELKANSTRVLRKSQPPITSDKIWSRGGDIEFIDSDSELDLVVTYIVDAQDRKF